MNRKEVSLFSSALALFHQTFQPGIGASAIYSSPSSRPLICSPTAYAGAGAFALLGLRASRVFPPNRPEKRLSHFSVLFILRSLRFYNRKDPGS
jgi:hypothetical protein